MIRDVLYARQLDILDPTRCEEEVHIIGAGATGSFAALSLAKMGVTNITIYDKDTVEEHNFPNQLFPLSALGKNKAKAVRTIVKGFTGAEITAVPKFFKKQPLRGIVISALDTMDGRKLIYNQCKYNEKISLLIDPRTGGEMFTLLTLNPCLEAEQMLYERTLVSSEQVVQAPCTARSIIYSVLVVSAYICGQVKKYLMNEEFKRDICVDMRNNFSLFE